MGLRETAQALAKTGMAAAGNVPVSATYESVGEEDYDASSGTASVNSTQYMVSMVFGSYKQREVDGQRVKPTDVKGQIAQLDLTPTPKLDDEVWRIEANATAVYEIIDIGQDPAGATWTFQLRKR